jgi:phage regulator Rha-like protein
LGTFPPDFVVQLTEAEAASLRSQIATLKTGRGQHRKYTPLAFTEHGAIMAATILNSPRAVEMSVYVVRAFVKLREVLASHAELARKLETLEKSVASLDANTRRQFEEVYGAILSLMGPSTAEQ